MVARGRGKKTAATAVASESVVAADVANGDDIPQEIDTGASSVAVVPASKKGRNRAAKKDESPSVEIAAEKPARPGKAPKGSKKAAKGKTPVEVEDVNPAEEIKKEEDLDGDDVASTDSKPAAAEKKAHHRKRKADSAEKTEEPIPVAKKVPRTKTKAAKKETVDSAGVPEDPSANATLPEVQTNGNKKSSSSSRKRAAPKAEEPAVDSVNEEEITEGESEAAPPAAKKSSKTKGSKKESKKAPLKSKSSKKVVRDEEIEEDAAEDDILPEDEFVPEELEEEEPPKVKKAIKSKGSRKQLKDDIPPVVQDEVAELEVESTIEEEKKPRGRKQPAAKKPAAAAAKKSTSKKATKAKKATKTESEESINEDQDAADIELSEGNTNGNAKTKSEKPEPATEKKGGRGRNRAVATPVDEADETDGSKHAKPEALLNPTITKYQDNDFSLDKEFKLKISSWNIAGLRSWLKKDGLQYLQFEQPDILCLQEIKCTTDQLPEEARIAGYHPYWLCMPGGHAGVAVYSKIMPIHVEYGIGNAEHDGAGRMITAEYEKFYLICVYVPNSGRKLVNLEKRMQWEELFREYVQRLDKIKPVVIAGDMNVSHKEIDLANPKTNTKNAGFTPEERDALTKLFELGYVDTFRHLYPDQKGAYSFWSYMGKARSKNVGWRLDYFIVSERITSKIVESTIRSQVLGSDHCPITLFLNI